MKEFRFLDYYTEYSCEGDLDRELEEAACFGYVFENIEDKQSVKYEIILYKGLDLCKNAQQSNACLFNIKQIRNHIEILKSLYKFSYSVREFKNRYSVKLLIKNVPATFHKYALTWVRYLYEFPYNMLLRDSYKLKKLPKFRFESIANIFNLTIGCYCNFVREIHQVPTNNVNARLSTKKLKQKIARVTQLNKIYEVLKEQTEKNSIPKKVNGFTVNDIEYWDSEEIFEARKSVYLKVYEDICRRRRN